MNITPTIVVPVLRAFGRVTPCLAIKAFLKFQKKVYRMSFKIEMIFKWNEYANLYWILNFYPLYYYSILKYKIFLNHWQNDGLPSTIFKWKSFGFILPHQHLVHCNRNHLSYEKVDNMLQFWSENLVNKLSMSKEKEGTCKYAINYVWWVVSFR